jgi:LacI family transcriptional regulator
MTGRPTITQLAAELGIAPSTVSRAFTRPNLLKPETVALVQKAAEAAGYVPNHHARALSTGRAGAIGLIVPDIANPFFPPLVRAAQNYASDLGLSVFLADTDEDANREDRLISRMAPQVEGLIVVSSRLPSARIRQIADSQRVAFINRDVAETYRVLLDTSAAIRSALTHLSELGHRRVAYVGGPPQSWANKQRRSAVDNFSKVHALEVTHFSADPGTYDAAKALADSVAASGVTAVIAFDDVIAHGLMGGFAAAGVDVPKDLSVIGCDDTLATTTFPALSTIAVNVGAAARRAVAALSENPGSTSLTGARIIFEGTLVLRGTTGAVRPTSSPLTLEPELDHPAARGVQTSRGSDS